MDNHGSTALIHAVQDRLRREFVDNNANFEVSPRTIGKSSTMSDAVSPLGPIDPASVPEAEQEKSAPWIVRKLVGVCRSSHLAITLLRMLTAQANFGLPQLLAPALCAYHRNDMATP
ncbi:hypothetical protein NUW54_g4685 [Trametes sanguinea]|uniref:Uncharacterized protein n=1 Tax=Trametes sanguinea TaxID=158606 RepID=A0ACC1PXS3_9APHY|nr:hypothetical protein NUW54_g4685 [Trametes sanguinea]